MSRYAIPNAGDFDPSGAARTASQHAGNSGEEDFFSSILGSLSGRHEQFANEEIDENRQQDLVQAHQTIFNGNGDAGVSNFGASSLGASVLILKFLIEWMLTECREQQPCKP